VNIQRIGRRGYLFIFELGEVGTDTGNVCVIRGKKHWFVIDTFLGPDAIGEITTYLGANFDKKLAIVINTHSHFDHFWGNCAFQNSMIIAHRLCRQGILQKQQVDYLEKNPEFQRGKVELVAPNVTFEKRMVFEDEGVELFYSPGHTRDAISCIDTEDQVLFVGDNVGLPIPSIYPGVKVEDFIATLETYRSLGLPRVVSSHYNVIEDDLIAANLRYLRKLLEDDTVEYDHGEYKFFNDWNKKMLARQVTEN
jgi:cyclase